MAYSDAGMKAYIHVAQLFFEIKGDSHSLRIDYKQRWTKFYRLNNLENYRDIISFIYSGEEPT